MSNEDPKSLIIGFEDLPVPRVEGRCDNKSIDIIVLALCSVIAGTET